MFSYECFEWGKSFQLEWGNFTGFFGVRCEADQKWSRSSLEPCGCKMIKFIFTIPNPLLGSHCITPPTPPPEHNLQLSWNKYSPPMHDQTITFNCNAGGPWNRFEHDFNQNSLTLKCLPDNKFETIQWPTCKSGDKIHQDMVLHLKSIPRYYLSKSYITGRCHFYSCQPCFCRLELQ